MIDTFVKTEAVMVAKISFGQWLKQRRKSLDLTREDLAQRIGCAGVTLKKIEADERRPSEQIAELLAEYLNIPADQRSTFIRFARSEAAADAAPWGTPFHPPTNLHAQPTALIGREADVATIRKRLLQPETRLLTLLGPPGIGKTRLSLQVAAEVLDNFAEGVFFVALAPISDAALVSATIASTLGVQEAGPQTPLQRLKAYLHEKQILLVLDNLEQILPAAPQIAELVSTCPWVKILVTSRAPLRVRSERQFPVSPLALPEQARLHDLEAVSHAGAITLFLERAQAVKPDFTITPENAPMVASICARLDGLPLAIELISARVKMLPPGALLERLSGRMLLQSDGLRDIEPRHRTLNNAIEWSYQLLNTDEQTLFRRLGVFVGGWTLKAAGAVCTENLNLNILDGLASLLDKSLIKQETMPDGEPRFLMLETIREYALEQLAFSGELEALQQRHASYFVALMETINPMMSEQYGQWLDRLEIEHANFRAVLNWSQTVVASETGLRLALALFGFWRDRGHLSEGSAWLKDALVRHKGEIDQALRAKALNTLGVLLVFQGELNAAQPYYEESLALFREHGEQKLLADMLGDYGMLFVLRDDPERAAPILEESLALWRELGDMGGITQTLFFLGNLAYIQGDNKLAEAFWEEGLAAKRAIGETSMIAILLANLAMTALDRGDHQKAEAYLTESLLLLRQMGEKWQLVHTLEVFARLAVEREQETDSERSLRRAARLFGAAEALRERLDAQIMEFQRHSHERGIAALRAQLDETVLALEWAEGRTMTLDQVVAYALKETTLFDSLPTTQADNTD